MGMVAERPMDEFEKEQERLKRDEQTVAFTVNVPVSFSQREVDDLLCAAFEQGIGYWCEGYHLAQQSDEPGECGYMAAGRPGGRVTLFVQDHPETGRNSHYLTREKLMRGIELMLSSTRFGPADLKDNHDANTADLAVQFALWGQEIFC
jgi:hypothetical protein